MLTQQAEIVAILHEDMRSRGDLLGRMLTQQAEIITILRENLPTLDLLSENRIIRAKSEEILFEITTACHTLQEILDQQAGSRAD